MSRRSPWSYAQARLQARHGERLDEVGWRALEAARSLDQFIERSRTTSLRRFTERVSANMTSHAIERALRAAWRDYVTEVANWSTVNWRPAILWTATLPDLPVIEALLKGKAPPWARQDPVLAAFLEIEQNSALEKSPLTVLLAGPRREQTLVRRWYAQWRSLWPRAAAERRALTALAKTIKAHVMRLHSAGAKDASASYRRDLVRIIIRMFRQHCATSVAAFSHLVLVALDLERLRGDLVRRALFGSAKEVA